MNVEKVLETIMREGDAEDPNAIETASRNVSAMSYTQVSNLQPIHISQATYLTSVPRKSPSEVDARDIAFSYLVA